MEQSAAAPSVRPNSAGSSSLLSRLNKRSIVGSLHRMRSWVPWTRNSHSRIVARTPSRWASRWVALAGVLFLVVLCIVFGSSFWVVETAVLPHLGEEQGATVFLRDSTVRQRQGKRPIMENTPERDYDVAVVQHDSAGGDTVDERRSSRHGPRDSSGFPNGAAIRAPSRPRRQIASSTAQELPASGPEVENTARCYDRTGAPTSVPRWFPGLYESARVHYQGLLDAAEDPWLILIGWVPDHFMRPQKLGRKANGDVMVPPTKGRNASYYLEAYNASWHARVQANQYEYHFQLVHRNALAVCVRERLHIFQWYCTPSTGSGSSGGGAVAPLTIYHCPCRHCQEGSLPQKGGKRLLPMDKAFPAFQSPLLRDPLNGEMKISVTGSVLEPPLHAQDGCIESLAAPWLLPRGASNALPYEGLEHNLGALLRVQADANKIVVVTIFNAFWLDHLHNFVYSMVSKAHIVNFIVATMDADALRLCLANRLPCFDATEYAEYEPDMGVGGAGRASARGRKVTEAMAWIKPRLAVAVLRRGYGFFMSDLDLTWNKSPWKEVLEVRVDIAHQCDANNKFSINSGFYLARANARTIRYFENIMSFRPEENSDQTAMKLFSRYDHTHGASNTCLGKWSFNMKCNYKVPGSVKTSGGVETFEWRPYDSKDVRWTILHATCLSGATAKMLYLRTIGAWSLDGLDAMTNQSKSSDVCLWLHSYPPAASMDAAQSTSAHGEKRQLPPATAGGLTVRGFLDKSTSRREMVRDVATTHDEAYVPGRTSETFLQKGIDGP